MYNVFEYILKGINKLGLYSYAYTFEYWLIFFVIEGYIIRGIENYFNIKHKVYFYDVFMVVIFIFIYVLGLYIIGVRQM